MAKHSVESHKFLKSLVILAAVLIIAVIVLYPKGEPEKDGEYRNDVTDILMKKRAEMRLSFARMNSTEKTAFMTISPETNTTLKAEPKSRKAKTQTESDKITTTYDVVGVDLEIQNAIESIDGGNVQEALSILEGVLHKDPKNEQALIEVAMIHLLDLKQQGKAISYLERVMSVNSSNRIVMTELVSLYNEDGSSDNGLSFLKSLYSKSGESADIAYGIGQLLSTQGRGSEAASYYEKALNSDDQRGQVYANLAESYSRSGNMEKAFVAYNSAIEEHEQDIAQRRQEGLPVNFDVERLGYLKVDYAEQLLKEGRTEEARRMLDDAEGVLPNDEAIMALKDRLDRKG